MNPIIACLDAGLGLVVNAVDPFSAVTIASQLIVFVWSFLILLVLKIYTGNAAAILQPTSGI
jgi:hypothetical protein